MFTAVFWFVISFIAYTCGDNIKFQQNLATLVAWAKMPRPWSTNRTLRCVKLFNCAGISMFNKNLRIAVSAAPMTVYSAT